MVKIVLTILIITIIVSCSNQTGKKQETEIKAKTVHPNDTTIGKKDLTNEIAGSSYRKRATGYFVIVNNDTSEFMPIISESKENGTIRINQNLPYSNENKLYSQRLEELQFILPEAAKDYNFDSLTSMSIGRLILSGDLAIIITEEYKKKYDEKEKIITADYKEISDFLLESTLTKDLNDLLRPFSKSVSRISIEKAFFTDKKVLLRYSKISRDSTEIPEKILDFITWIEFKDE